MKSFTKFIIFIAIFLEFLIGTTSAQKFYIKFVDANNDNSINFQLIAINKSDETTYYTGVAPPNDHKNHMLLLTILPDTKVKKQFIWQTTASEKSFLYDIYLTPDNYIYYWTSQGDSRIEKVGKNLVIYWENLSVIEKFKPLKGDRLQIVPVPIPSSLWLLTSGTIILLIISLMRKKIFDLVKS